MKIQYFFAVSESGLSNIWTVILLKLYLMAIPESEEGRAFFLTLDGFMGTSQTPITDFLILGVRF